MRRFSRAASDPGMGEEGGLARSLAVTMFVFLVFAVGTTAEDRCLTCHRRVAPHSRWKGSVHERSGLTCTSCHSDHGSDPLRGAGTRFLAAASESETCFKCHAEIRHAQTQRSTHLFRDDRKRPLMTCSSCHDAHGGTRKSGNDVCYSCHDDKRGPFLWEHAPVRENCANCHAPHGSNNRSLLVMRPPLLCQSCHVGDAHVSSAGSTYGVLEMNRSCVNCHQLVHGSNHPSGITLQR